MHSHNPVHHSRGADGHSHSVPITLPKELFTNKIAQELQHKDVQNIAQALATLDHGLIFLKPVFLNKYVLYFEEDDPRHMEIQKIESMGEKVIGTGSFGTVFQGRIDGSDRVIAIKQVVQDRKYKVRICFQNTFYKFILIYF